MLGKPFAQDGGAGVVEEYDDTQSAIIEKNGISYVNAQALAGLSAAVKIDKDFKKLLDSINKET
ncbi:hypothetical protein ACYULU_05430 [Breznakiellaceae bacterium SP9]